MNLLVRQTAHFKIPLPQLIESDRIVPALLEVNAATHSIKSDLAALRRGRRKSSDQFPSLPADVALALLGMISLGPLQLMDDLVAIPTNRLQVVQLMRPAMGTVAVTLAPG